VLYGTEIVDAETADMTKGGMTQLISALDPILLIASLGVGYILPRWWLAPVAGWFVVVAHVWALREAGGPTPDDTLFLAKWCVSGAMCVAGALMRLRSVRRQARNERGDVGKV
jgi:hypothetical protein